MAGDTDVGTYDEDDGDEPETDDEVEDVSGVSADALACVPLSISSAARVCVVGSGARQTRTQSRSDLTYGAVGAVHGARGH